MSRYALVVGVSQYQNFPNLKKTINDANAIANILREHGKYEVTCLPARFNEAKTHQIIVSDDISYQTFEEAISNFLNCRAKNSEALIYFAGHGFEASVPIKDKAGFLATSDSNKTGQNALPFKALDQFIRKSSINSLVVILDCCYAGLLPEKSLVESSFTAFESRRGYYLLAACRGFERAREGSSHGILTEALLEGLKVEHADANGQISCDLLYNFVASRLRNSGQEPVRSCAGGLITLVDYHIKPQLPKAVLNAAGELVCPYQSLEAFTGERKDFFFGREEVVENIRQQLTRSALVPIIGASGSGKSSVVKAGLVPLLAGEKLGVEEKRWQILEMKPGGNPLSKLCVELEPLLKTRDRRKLEAFVEDSETYPDGMLHVINLIPNLKHYLLVIDQFEEVFTICTHESKRQRFIDLITQIPTPMSRLSVVITMRADFLEPCLRYPALQQLIQSQVILMPPLSSSELVSIILEPARRQGHQIEESLLFRIIDDASKESSFLPLLEFALTKVWDKREKENKLLCLRHYEAIGGLSGALDKYSSRVYTYQDFELSECQEERSEKEKEWIKHLFLRLVRVRNEKFSRQRQSKTNLLAMVGDDPDRRDSMSELIEELISSRLLIADSEAGREKWIGLAHEALIKGWNQLSLWLEENTKVLVLRDQIENRLKDWEEEKIEGNLLPRRSKISA